MRAGGGEGGNSDNVSGNVAMEGMGGRQHDKRGGGTMHRKRVADNAAIGGGGSLGVRRRRGVGGVRGIPVADSIDIGRALRVAAGWFVALVALQHRLVDSQAR